MVTIFVILIILGVLLAVICTGAIVLIDPIIAILIIYGFYKLVRWLTGKKKK